MPGPGALAPGSPPASPCRWKLHIIRQLQQRDRRQKALFLDLVEAYHRLLEKSDLLAHFTEKLPPESPSEPSREEEEAGPMPDPTQSPEDLKRKWEEELAKIKLICGEMAYQVVEKHMTLSSQDAMLEDQQGRTLDPPSIAEPPANKQELLVVEAYEKQWKRPFRSASATSMTLARCMDVMKGLLDFRKRRGHSVSGAPEARYPSIRVCGVSCLPARAQDIQEAHCSEVNAVCFSSNSSLLATGGADRLIRLWNVIGGRLEADQMLEGAGGSVTSLEFEPSGCYLLAATYNKAAQLWKVGESQSKETLSGHTDKVTAAKFKLTRQQAVTGSRDRTVKEWDLNKVSCSRTLDGLSYCNDVVCGDHLIISGHNDQKIRFWDSRVPRCIQVIPVEGKVTSLSISNDQMHLLSCSRDDALKVIDLRVNNIRQVFRADGFKCGSDWTKAVFSPDKSYALAGSADGGLYIWNLESGKLESSLYGPHSVSINAVAWCYAGTHVVSVDQGKKAVLWS
uniref:Protein Atg16l2 n=1 Tax=Phascolarctos cinereus TaxID=38626 RepID=A0A6P5KI18_PHACI|nr:autophagy-related protein 16-2 isoform X7 [Phascolarctos cinereus]